jgi:hypothetical protein
MPVTERTDDVKPGELMRKALDVVGRGGQKPLVANPLTDLLVKATGSEAVLINGQFA